MGCLKIILSVSPSLCLSLVAAATLVSPAAAQAPDEPPGRWQLESLTLQDGSTIRGLIQTQSEAEIDFAQILQPPGKPMYAVVRGIPLAEVKAIERLDEAGHLALFERFALFRNRAVIEAGRMDQLELTARGSGATRTLHYDGPWFSLTSTADEEQTRRCLVRIEQLFRAYRTLLPPRAKEPRPLAVRLFGSVDQYRESLRELSLELDNAAFYSPREAAILAASDLNLFAERLAQVRREHERVKATLARLDREQTQRLAVVAQDLKAAGFGEAEIAGELRQRRATWKRELETTLAAGRERERAAEQKFGQVTEKMFAGLAHESFHAWLDAFVFPHQRHHVPRWLNEGLAQVFESGQLDGESLRLDAPDKQRLAALRADLASSQPLRLTQVLTAGEREFLGLHSGGTPQRHYLYAWGLAHYLTFDGNLLSSGRLDAYVSPAAERLDPIARFEQLAGQPLPEFETAWRAAMTGAAGVASP